MEDTCQWVVKVHNLIFPLCVYCFLTTSFVWHYSDLRGGVMYMAYLVCADQCNPYGCYFKVRWADMKFYLHGFCWAVGRLSSKGKERLDSFFMFMFLHFFCRLCFSFIEVDNVCHIDLEFLLYQCLCVGFLVRFGVIIFILFLCLNFRSSWVFPQDIKYFLTLSLDKTWSASYIYIYIYI